MATTTCWASSFILILAMFNELEAASPKGIISNLTDLLLTGYGPTTALPVFDVDKQMDVGIDLVILRVIDLNERYQTLKLSGFLSFSWYDDYLTWNTTAYQGVRFLVLPADTIWLPDIHLFDSVDSTFQIPKDVSVRAYPNGTVGWTIPVILYTACRIDARFFPFDKQRCSLRFESWNYDSDQLKLYPLLINRTKEETLEYFIENGEWHLEDIKSDDFIKEYSDTDNTFAQVVFTLHLHRRPLFHVLSFIIPCGLLSLLNLLTFVIPTQSGEKVSLGITNLLALILYQQLISGSLPPSGIEIPVLRYYFTPMILIGCLSIVDGVVVALLYHHDGTKPVPKWLLFLTKVGAPRSVTTLQPTQTVNEQETLLTNSTSTQTSMTVSNNHKISILEEKQKNTILTAQLGNPVEYTSDWQQVASVVDRYFLVLGTVVTLVSFTITVILFLTSNEGNETEI